MSPAERDPLEELRARWQDLAPPPPGDELAAEPAEVRVPLERLRDAWRALEPAAGDADAARRAVRAWAAAQRAPAGVRPDARVGWSVLAAAAAALAALIGGGAWLAARGGEGPQGARPAYVATAPPAPESAEPPGAPPAENAPRLAAVAVDRIEIRSGNVRLVWLTDLAPGTTPETNEPDEDER
jgi:hypothetical protein